MDTEAKRLCPKYHGCQVTGKANKSQPIHRVVPPSGPRQDCSCDILGPLIYPAGNTFLSSLIISVVIMRLIC